MPCERDVMRPRERVLNPHGNEAIRIENHIRTFDALHRGVHHFADASDVFVVDRVALRFAHFLEDDLLRQLRGNPAKNAFGNFSESATPPISKLGLDLRASSSVICSAGSSTCSGVSTTVFTA